MTKELTVKQTKLVKGIAEGKTKRQAGIDAGYSGTPETVSVSVNEALKNPNVQEALQDEMARQGITLEKIIAPVKQALEATTIVKTTDGEIETKYPDIDTRLKGHDRAVRLLNNTKKPEGNTFNFNFKGGASFSVEKYKK